MHVSSQPLGMMYVIDDFTAKNGKLIEVFLPEYQLIFNSNGHFVHADKPRNFTLLMKEKMHLSPLCPVTNISKKLIQKMQNVLKVLNANLLFPSTIYTDDIPSIQKDIESYFSQLDSLPFKE